MLAIMMLGGIVISAPAPAPDNNLAWLYQEPEVRAAEKAGRWGEGRYRITVAPDGKPVHCEATMSAGETEFGDIMCAAVMAHAHFRPAHYGDAARIYGTYSEPFGYSPKGGPFSTPPTFDAWFDVNHLPSPGKGYLDIARTRASVFVGPDGRISDCEAELEFGPAQLQSLTCKQIVATMHPAAAKDAAGNAVASVQLMEIVFAGPGVKTIPAPIIMTQPTP